MQFSVCRSVHSSVNRFNRTPITLLQSLQSNKLCYHKTSPTTGELELTPCAGEPKRKGIQSHACHDTLKYYL